MQTEGSAEELVVDFDPGVLSAVATAVGAPVVGSPVVVRVTVDGGLSSVDAGTALVDVLLTSVVSVLLPPPAVGLFHASQNVGSSSVPREQSGGS